MSDQKILTTATLGRDLTSGLVVFLVALPLCLGIAFASDAPLFSGLLSGIIGGILVGFLSGSHTSVSGPAAGLTAVVAMQIGTLGSFQAFLLAVFIAGILQIILGLVRAGFIAAFFPTSVIKGLLAAIGVILILKQIPHVFGHDADPEGDMSFIQPDHESTFSELAQMFSHIHQGALIIGFTSFVILIFWDKLSFLKKLAVPPPLIIILLGVGVNMIFGKFGGVWEIQDSHLVSVPIAKSFKEFSGFFQSPDFSQWMNPAVYFAAVTIAAVASLETLLNLEAVDKLDPKQNHSPPSRELFAQGCGNVAAGLLGGIPVTSVIIRSSVNIDSKCQTKLSAIFHGILLLVCVMFLPNWLNMIPLSSLAAILLVTGIKLASPKLFKQMWSEGRYQFIPFIVTLLAIVFTDILIGTLIGLAVSMGFILNSNLRRPIHRIMEKHLGGDVLHIELSNQVSFLNRAALIKIFDEVPRGGHVLINAKKTDYIDPDILDLIRDFKEKTAPAHELEVSLIGFRTKYQLDDEIQYVDYSTRELQDDITPQQVLQIFKEGNERFRTGNTLSRDLSRQVNATATGQHPLAVVLSCIDSRVPVELIFDLGIGDVFIVRIAGNITSEEVLGSIEYSCAVAGAKLILVLGHTRCGAVTSAVKLANSNDPISTATGCQNIEHLIQDIQKSIPAEEIQKISLLTDAEQEHFVDEVAKVNVSQSVENILKQSETLNSLAEEGKIAVVGAMYDVTTGEIVFLDED
jgi:MFS superfamily sulfate permease-like transporter